MQEIANTEAYTLTVDIVKNRIYWIVTDYGLAGYPTLAQDWEKARGLISRGFTVLTDTSRMRQISEDWEAIEIGLFSLLVQDGLAGVAEILSEIAAEKRHIRGINRIPGTCYYAKKEIFTNRRIAEAWLDRIASTRSARRGTKR